MELLDYLAGTGLEMSCHPAYKAFGVSKCWRAEIDGVWTKITQSNPFMKATEAHGPTADEAMANYAKKIAGKVLAQLDGDECFDVPADLTHTPGYRFGPEGKDGK